ncbi:MAG: DUF998 domain-containing protein [Bacteroidales bacterium]
MLVWLGMISPLVFWLTTFVCGMLLGDYNGLSNLVSELGAQGTRTQYLFSFGLVLSAFLNVLFVSSLWRICKEWKQSIVPLLPMFCYSFLAGPALVPMPLPLHGVVGMPFPLILLAPLFALLFWKKDLMSPALKMIAVAGLIVMLLGFLIFAPGILSGYHGLKQRFLYAGWTMWSSAISMAFLRIHPRPPLQTL